MSKGWTPERRAKQAEAIRRWKPWERATGPRSAEGKARSALNAYQGGLREQLRELTKQLNEALQEQKRQLDGWGGE